MTHYNYHKCMNCAHWDPEEPREDAASGYCLQSQPLKNCATCKHWEELPPYDTDQLTAGYDDDEIAEQKAARPFRVGKCLLACNQFKGNSDWENETPDRGGAIAMDASGYRAALMTAFDFGCVRWAIGILDP